MAHMTHALTEYFETDFMPVYDAVVYGLECGDYSSFVVEGDWRKGWEAAEKGVEDSFAGIVLSDKYVGEGYEAAGPPISLTDANIKRGLDLLQKKHAKAWARVVTSDGDALDGDMMLQLMAFGEVVYG